MADLVQERRGSRRPAYARVGWIAAAVAIGSIAACLAAWIALRPPSLGYDLLILESAAERLIAGQPLYLDPTAARFVPGSIELFYGPPALAVASLPLAPLGESGIRLLAMPLSLATVLISLAALISSVRRWIPARGILMLVLGTLLSFAVLWGSTLGAASVLVVFLLSMTWLGLARRGGEIVAALALGTAIALRLYPAALLVPLVLGGRWRVGLGSVAVSGAWVLVGVIVAGLDQTILYVDVARALAGLDSPPGSVAPGALAAGAGLPPLIVTGIRVGSLLLGGAALIIGGRALRPRGPELRSAEADPWNLLGWGLACAGMLLVTPVVWDHYLTALLPLAVGLVAVTRRAIVGLLPAAFLPGVLGGIALVGTCVACLTLAVRRRLATDVGPAHA